MGYLIGGETDRTTDYIIYDFPAGPAMQEVPRPHCRWGDLLTDFCVLR